MNLTYNHPVKIIFGSHKLNDLYNILKDGGLSNGMLVCDPYFINTGLANKVMHYSKGLLTDIFFDIKPNPTITSVDKCADVIRNKDIKFLAAIGGGSALDCAKAAASVCKTSFSIVHFHSGNHSFIDSHIPVIAIPTTAGTGSEVSNEAVLTDPIRGMKSPIVCDNFYPTIAIVDPVLTLSLPKKATAATGFDALSHALEAFWSRYHKPAGDELATQAAKLIFENLYRVYEDGSDLVAREKMSEASVLAGLAVNLSSTTASHACSYPLTYLYNIRHGEACAFTLDSILKINSEAEDGRLHQLAVQIGFKDAYDMADKIVKMKASMEMKSTLKEAGIDTSEIDNLSILSMQPDMINNPIVISIEKLIEMYHALNK
ncbi:MAG: iron-containing alcohol dehydrogenase family protein [Lutisporaceae bacterium]